MQPKTIKLHLHQPFRLRQALTYAKARMPVLPLFECFDGECACDNVECQRPGKHPRIRNGVQGASIDPRVIADWWQKWPLANVAIATGGPLRLLVLDVDGRDGQAALETLQAQYGQLPRTACVRTGRPDSNHWYFRASDRKISNRSIVPGLDVRGDTGYATTYPSVHVSGQVYKWEQLPVRIARAPDWLTELVRPDTQSARERVKLTSHGAVSSNYFDTALRNEINLLDRAEIGDRNNTLNRAAFNLGQLCTPEGLSNCAVADRLHASAIRLGLASSEAKATIESGLSAGQLRPREVLQSSADLQSPPDNKDALAEELARLGETDADNAQRFARRSGAEVAYDPGRGWLVYSRLKWERDDSKSITLKAEQCARAIATEAVHLPSELRRNREQFARRTFSNLSMQCH